MQYGRRLLLPCCKTTQEEREKGQNVNQFHVDLHWRRQPQLQLFAVAASEPAKAMAGNIATLTLVLVNGNRCCLCSALLPLSGSICRTNTDQNRQTEKKKKKKRNTYRHREKETNVGTEEHSTGKCMQGAQCNCVSSSSSLSFSFLLFCFRSSRKNYSHLSSELLLSTVE